MCQPFHIHLINIIKFHLMYNYISMHQKKSCPCNILCEHAVKCLQIYQILKYLFDIFEHVSSSSADLYLMALVLMASLL